MAHGPGGNGRPVVTVDVDIHPQGRPAERTGLQRLQRIRLQMAADDFRAAGDVHHRAAPAAHLLKIPGIAGLIPDFPRGSKHPEPAEIVGLGTPSIRGPDQRANQGRRTAQGNHAQARANLPKPIAGRMVGRAVEHHDRGPLLQAADDLPGPHHPADVRHPEKRFAGLRIEGMPNLLSHLRQTSGVGMHGAFGTPGGAAGVDDQAGILRRRLRRWHRLAVAVGEKLLPVGIVGPHHAGNRWYSRRRGPGNTARVRGPTPTPQGAAGEEHLRLA